MKTLQEAKEGCMCVLSKLHFQSDKLTFHPQTAEDCNWKIFAADQKYQVFQIHIYKSMFIITQLVPIAKLLVLIRSLIFNTQISKAEVDNYAKVTYHLVLTQLHSSVSTDLCIPVTFTGGDIKFIHVISEANPGSYIVTISNVIVCSELLQILQLVLLMMKFFTSCMPSQFNLTFLYNS